MTEEGGPKATKGGYSIVEPMNTTLSKETKTNLFSLLLKKIIF